MKRPMQTNAKRQTGTKTTAGRPASKTIPIGRLPQQTGTPPEAGRPSFTTKPPKVSAFTSAPATGVTRQPTASVAGPSKTIPIGRLPQQPDISIMPVGPRPEAKQPVKAGVRSAGGRVNTIMPIGPAVRIGDSTAPIRKLGAAPTGLTTGRTVPLRNTKTGVANRPGKPASITVPGKHENKPGRVRKPAGFPKVAGRGKSVSAPGPRVNLKAAAARQGYTKAKTTGRDATSSTAKKADFRLPSKPQARMMRRANKKTGAR